MGVNYGVNYGVNDNYPVTYQFTVSGAREKAFTNNT